MVMRKAWPIILALVIAVAAVVLAGPTIYHGLTGGKNRETTGLDASAATAATTDVNGTWHVVNSAGGNTTSAGFSVWEILPGQERKTSGSTEDVTGQITVVNNEVTSGEIIVELENISTDEAKRDHSIRARLLHTVDYPTASFVLTQPVDVSNLPEDGTSAVVPVTGDLTIHGVTREVTADLETLRTGNAVVMSGNIIILREDFDVQSPTLVAARIAKEVSVDLRIAMSKTAD